MAHAGDLAAILTNLQEHDVLFIDEIHRLPASVEEALYPAMEDFQLDLVIGQGPATRTVKLDLPQFHARGRDDQSRFPDIPAAGPIWFGLSAGVLWTVRTGGDCDAFRRSLRHWDRPGGCAEISRRARGTPRIVNQLIKRIRDYAQIKADGHITERVAKEGLAWVGIDDGRLRRHGPQDSS